jgi:hypothetical protein
MLGTIGALALAASVAAKAPAQPLASAAGTARAAARPAAPASTAPPKARARLVAAARRHVGRPFPGDCSGFVARVFAEARVPLPAAADARSGTEAIARRLARTSRPRPGDVAWFHRTHDRDPPGPGRNLFTHLAIVEAVDGPRVTLVHRGNDGVRRLRIDLSRRSDPRANSALRRRSPGDPPGRRILASELLGGFGTALRDGGAVAAQGAAGRERAGRASPRR